MVVEDSGLLEVFAVDIVYGVGELNGLVSCLNFGRSGRDRTPDLRFWRPLLFQLSYTPNLKVGLA